METTAPKGILKRNGKYINCDHWQRNCSLKSGSQDGTVVYGTFIFIHIQYTDQHHVHLKSSTVCCVILTIHVEISISLISSVCHTDRRSSSLSGVLITQSELQRKLFTSLPRLCFKSPFLEIFIASSHFHTTRSDLLPRMPYKSTSKPLIKTWFHGTYCPKRLNKQNDLFCV